MSNGGGGRSSTLKYMLCRLLQSPRSNQVILVICVRCKFIVSQFSGIGDFTNPLTNQRAHTHKTCNVSSLLQISISFQNGVNLVVFPSDPTRDPIPLQCFTAETTRLYNPTRSTEKLEPGTGTVCILSLNVFTPPPISTYSCHKGTA